MGVKKNKSNSKPLQRALFRVQVTCSGGRSGIGYQRPRSLDKVISGHNERERSGMVWRPALIEVFTGKKREGRSPTNLNGALTDTKLNELILGPLMRENSPSILSVLSLACPCTYFGNFIGTAKWKRMPGTVLQPRRPSAPASRHGLRVRQRRRA